MDAFHPDQGDGSLREGQHLPLGAKPKGSDSHGPVLLPSLQASISQIGSAGGAFNPRRRQFTPEDRLKLQYALKIALINFSLETLK